MRWTEFLIPTLKEDPQDAEAVSHKLMVRAGLIRRLTAGAYIYLPLGLKVLKKVEQIVREEMNKTGAIELFMPALQPVELWKKTGRYDVIGDVMIKFLDRHGKEIALGPTHEEIITDLVSREIRSYKDLPICLYQIQTKFRDEVRPRFGVVRSSEFIMKDAYSFDKDEDALEIAYSRMYQAYCNIFTRCGLPYIPVLADTGMMGGRVSHEFMIPSLIGEDRIVVCSSCKYAASTEIAPAVLREGAGAGEEKFLEKNLVNTPGKVKVDDISVLLNVSKEKIIKTLIYMADGKPVAILLRGDHEANEAKIKNKLKVVRFAMADEKNILDVTRGARGFSGPCGLNIPIYADFAVKGIINAVTGANIVDAHYVNVNYERDFNVTEWIDARVITEKDPCPKCGAGIEIKNALEVGHTFKLGTKYSQALNAKYLDENGHEKVLVMGCYGIGVTRIIPAIIETNADKDGIVWPITVAPYEVIVICLNNKDDMESAKEAERIYRELSAKNIDALLDDRFDKSPGVKFKDADLIGIPLQIVVGKKSLAEGNVEIRDRKMKSSHLINKEEAAEYIYQKIKILTRNLSKN
ncbi:prolyl-tRNA synthetase [Candidatus Omnitrophus magneticus]|uniref:Proline--tRNA ligase n=1 Tax=Candidatus Omnitrophus magneticus TaxID=1609969 RepID=A0A0F0CP14_9BACT|nr:prolyl-tRNA synthetase [Candidatus Omnitrophus magneticus]